MNPAEVVEITCIQCDDTLKTTTLSTEIMLCSCGATALDHGIVQLFPLK